MYRTSRVQLGALASKSMHSVLCSMYRTQVELLKPHHVRYMYVDMRLPFADAIHNNFFQLFPRVTIFFKILKILTLEIPTFKNSNGKARSVPAEWMFVLNIELEEFTHCQFALKESFSILFFCDILRGSVRESYLGN